MTAPTNGATFRTTMTMAQTTTQVNNKSVEYAGKPKRLPKGVKKLSARGLISPKQIGKMKVIPRDK